MPATNWLAAQAWLFGAAVLAGLIIGLGYHLYHAAIDRRGRGHWRRFLAADALFGAVAILFIVCYWFLLTDGSLYPSDFIWMACGCVLYRLTLKRAVESIRLRLLRRRQQREQKRRAATPPPSRTARRPPGPGRADRQADKLPALQNASLRINLFLLRSALSGLGLVRKAGAKAWAKMARHKNDPPAEDLPPDDVPPLDGPAGDK